MFSGATCLIAAGRILADARLELSALLGSEDSIELRARNRAHAVDLRLDRLQERIDAAVLLIDDRVHRRALRGREGEIVVHGCPRRPRVILVRVPHHALGGESDDPANEQRAKKEHQRLLLGPLHYGLPLLLSLCPTTEATGDHNAAVKAAGADVLSWRVAR